MPQHVENKAGTLVEGSARWEAMRDFWADLATRAPPGEFDEGWRLLVEARCVQARHEALQNIGDLEENRGRAVFDLLTAPVDGDEVRSAIFGLQLSKAAGADGVQPFMLKWGREPLFRALTKLFNEIWTDRVVPAQWKEVLVVPIHKRGEDRSKPQGHRPISLVSMVGKLLSSILHKRLSKFCYETEAIPDAQHGFRPGRGCPEVILSLRELSELRRAQGLQTFAAFLDVSKAYDTVWRDGLMSKLKEAIGSGTIWHVLNNWYRDDRSCIYLEGTRSSWWTNLLGVKQGDILSPLLYSLFISDIVSALRERRLGVTVNGKLICILLYADDITLLADSAEQLQQMLNVVAQFAQKWRFAFNHAKSKVMVFGAPNSAAVPVALWHLGGGLLQQVDVFKYLGVRLSADGTCDTHVTDLLARGRQRLGWLKHVGLTQGGFPFKLARACVVTCLLPLLEWGVQTYVCAVSPLLVRRLDTLWNDACRAVVGVPRHTKAAVVFADIAVLPLHIRRAILIARLHHKVVRYGGSSIVHSVYIWRRHQYIHGGRNTAVRGSFWYHQVSESLRLLGLDHVLRDNDAETLATDGKTWYSLVQSAARRCFLNWFQQEISGPDMQFSRWCSPRGPNQQPAAYLLSLGRRAAAFVCSLRASSLALFAGRQSSLHVRAPGLRGLSACLLCGHELEDLAHFVLFCPAYGHFRAPIGAAAFLSLERVAQLLSWGKRGPSPLQSAVAVCLRQMWLHRQVFLSDSAEQLLPLPADPASPVGTSLDSGFRARSSILPSGTDAFGPRGGSAGL